MPPNIVGSLLAAQQQQQQQLPQAMGALTESLQGMNQRSMMKDLQPQMQGGGLNRQAIYETANRWNQDPIGAATALDPVLKAQLKERLSVAGPVFLNKIQVEGMEPLTALAQVDQEFNLGEDGITAMLGLMKTYAEAKQARTTAQKDEYGFNRLQQGNTNIDSLNQAAFGEVAGGRPLTGVPAETLNSVLGQSPVRMERETQNQWQQPTGTMKEAAEAGMGLIDYKTATNPPGSNITVNTGDKVGTVPTGYALRQTDDGKYEMYPIEGGPAEREIQEAERKRQAGAEVKGTAAQTVFEDTERALDVLNKWGHLSAGVAGKTSWLPTAPAHQLQMHIDSIKGNIGVDQLLKIKESGAGLGHIPQQQLEMLASLLGKLDPSMKPEDLQYNIQRIQEIYADIVEKSGGDPQKLYQERQERFSGKQQNMNQKSDEELFRIIQGGGQ